VRKVALWTVAVVTALALVLTLTAVWTVRRAFPQHDGGLRLPGLTAPVTVHRDDHGIPQVRRLPRTCFVPRATSTRRIGSGRWTSAAI